MRVASACVRPSLSLSLSDVDRYDEWLGRKEDGSTHTLQGRGGQAHGERERSSRPSPSLGKERPGGDGGIGKRREREEGWDDMYRVGGRGEASFRTYTHTHQGLL